MGSTRDYGSHKPICSLCAIEKRLGKRRDVNLATVRGRTREGVNEVAMCDRHRELAGVGKVEVL